VLGSTNQATAAAVHVEQRNGEITSHFQLLPVRTEAHQRTVEGAIARIRDGAVIVRVPFRRIPLMRGQPQKTSAGTLARGADLHEGTLIDASALRDLEPALAPAGPLVHLLPQAHGREVGSSARETGGVTRSFPDGGASQALVYNGASAGAAMATSTSNAVAGQARKRKRERSLATAPGSSAPSASDSALSPQVTTNSPEISLPEWSWPSYSTEHRPYSGAPIGTQRRSKLHTTSFLQGPFQGVWSTSGTPARAEG
jgi:hypothetical protein